MSIISSKQQKVLGKSRNRIYGRKKSHDEILKEIVKLALQGTEPSKIAEITGKERSTVWRYLNEANEQGLIQKTSTGRIKLAQQIKDSKVYEIVDKDRFVKKYKVVADWVADMQTRKGGKPVVAWRSNLNKLKTTCDTLNLNPYELLSAKNGKQHGGAESALRDFAHAMQTGQIKYASTRGSKPTSDDISTRFFNYVMAVRNFCAVNGVSIPPKINGVLSGKKQGYAKYSHVKLSFEKIDECVKLLGGKYGYASKEQALFVFYYLTCARKQAGLDVKVHTITLHESGWVTCRVYESKTDQTYTKLIPNDNPHQQIFLDYMKKREGCKYLFGDSVEELNKTYDLLPSIFEEIYRLAGIKEEYFYIMQVHALRHVGAHYWLNRTNYNHVIVSRIGGWKSVQTLIDCYGQPDEDYIIQFLTNNHKSIIEQK
jgi:predicted transcriptional regulator